MCLFQPRRLTSMHLHTDCPRQAPMGARSSSAKNWGWAVTRRTCLNGSTISTQGPTSDAKLAAIGTKSTCIVGLSVICRGQPDSGESCIVLQSRLTCSLIAKFPQRSVVACSTRISCCGGRTLRMRPQTGVLEFSMVGDYMENPEKTAKLKIGGWALARDNTV